MNDEINDGSVCGPMVEFESAAVHSYLNILQSVINRMAANSASCKSWCITLVTGIIVVLINKDKSEFIYISLVPAFLFTFLDCYYLAAEKGFRGKYNAFIGKLHEGTAVRSDLFIVLPETNINFRSIFSCLKSHSILPFYLTLIIIVFVILYHFQPDAVKDTIKASFMYLFNKGA